MHAVVGPPFAPPLRQPPAASYWRACCYQPVQDWATATLTGLEALPSVVRPHAAPHIRPERRVRGGACGAVTTPRHRRALVLRRAQSRTEVDKPRWAAATAHRGTGRRPASASGTPRKESLPTPQPWGRRTSDRLSSAGTCRACSRARTPACRRTGRPCAGTGAATPCLRGQWPARQQARGVDPWTPPPGSIKTKTS